MSQVRFELVNCQNTILREIDMLEMKPKDIAQTYALAMRSEESIEWSVVNRAILNRWNRSTLERIKSMAHSGKCFQ
jgi:hypothetical protein